MSVSARLLPEASCHMVYIIRSDGEIQIHGVEMCVWSVFLCVQD